MLYFHGTTMKAAEEIMKNGFDKDIDRIWHDSDDEKAYFYKSEIDGNELEGFYRAIENAQLAAAIEGSNDADLGIIILETDYEMENDDSGKRVYEDAVQIEIEELRQLLENGAACLRLFECEAAYVPGLRFFYISGIHSGEIRKKFSDIECRAMDVISKADTYGIWEKLVDDVVYNYDIEKYLKDNNIAGTLPIAS